MAENVQITQGSGTAIAADDIGGVLHQRVKLSQGADGSATDVSSAAPLNVTLANTGANGTPIVVDLGSNNDVTVTGSVAVTGTFYQATQPVSAASLPLPTGAATSALQTQPGVDIGDVTINNASGASAVNIQDGGNSITVDGTFWQATQPVSGTVTANAGTGTMAVSMATNTPLGTVAHDSADSGAPIKTGGRAVSAEITPVTTGDRTDSIHDLAGKQVIMPYANNENFVSGAITTAMTGTTSTSLVAAPAAGLRNYITTIIVSNSHATVGTDVIIQDGSGGTTLMTIPAAAVYGGAVINLPVPLRQPTTATAIYCANVTTGASTKVSAVGYKGY